jgi:hypothetical protein
MAFVPWIPFGSNSLSKVQVPLMKARVAPGGAEGEDDEEAL